MAFYLRKSVNFGPLRLNLSKSGVGVSAGIRGFRVGTGPRGNYVHLGRNGLYYRKTINPKTAKSPVKPQPTNPEFDHPSAIEEPEMQEIESGDVLSMEDSSAADLLAELNKKQKTPRMWPAALVGGVIAIAAAYYYTAPPELLGGVLIAVILLTALAIWRDKRAKTVVLLFDFEPEFEAAYRELHEAFDALRGAAKRWHVEAQGAVRDRKYHAGADAVVKRTEIGTYDQPPTLVKTNISVPGIPAGRQTLYFFPERMLVFDSAGVGAIPYSELTIDVERTQFVESGTVPKDSKIVDRTWQYVNKRGGPDRRFKNNRELPIVLYEDISLRSPSGLNERIEISKVGVGDIIRGKVSALEKLL